MFKIVLIFIVLIFLIGFGYWSIGAYDCWKKLSDSNFDYRYHVLKGCQYHGKNGWLLYDRLRDGME